MKLSRPVKTLFILLALALVTLLFPPMSLLQRLFTVVWFYLAGRWLMARFREDYVKGRWLIKRIGEDIKWKEECRRSEESLHAKR